MTTYKPAQVARMTGISTSSVKVYTTRHTSHFSPGATPEPGARRYFSENDAKVLAFIAHYTNQGVNHDEIAAKLADGELSAFEWMPPATTGQDARQTSQEGPQQETALVLIQHMAAQLDAATSREIEQRDRAREREEALQEEINSLQHDLGLAQGELAAIKSQARPWWVRWFSR